MDAQKHEMEEMDTEEMEMEEADQKRSILQIISDVIGVIILASMAVLIINSIIN